MIVRSGRARLRKRPDASRGSYAYTASMALYRNRWLQLLAGLALALQLLFASGLAMAAPSDGCGSEGMHAMSGDECTACVTQDHAGSQHSSSLCKLACAMMTVAAPLPLRLYEMQPTRDAAPICTVSLQDQSSPDDLLRPPADAALLVA